MTDGKRAENRRRLEADIVAAAERLLASRGAQALTLRGVAAEVGLVPSALYRYYPGIDALLTALIIRAFDAMGEAARAAEGASLGQPPAQRALAICRGVRAWALEHPHRFALIYGSPVPGYVAPQETVAHAGRTADVLFDVLRERSGEPPVGAASGVGVADAFAARSGVAEGLLAGALDLFTTLIGSISLELFGHWVGVLDDPAALFDEVVGRRVSALLG